MLLHLVGLASEGALAQTPDGRTHLPDSCV